MFILGVVRRKVPLRDPSYFPLFPKTATNRLLRCKFEGKMFAMCHLSRKNPQFSGAAADKESSSGVSKLMPFQQVRLGNGDDKHGNDLIRN
jgi:hypothetical protein